MKWYWFTCVCVCRVCVWGLIRMQPVTRNTNEPNCREKWTANERNLWLRRTHNPSETLESLSVSVRGLTPRFVCQREFAEGRARSSLTLAGCSSVHFEVRCARFEGSKNRKIKYSCLFDFFWPEFFVLVFIFLLIAHLGWNRQLYLQPLMTFKTALLIF